MKYRAIFDDIDELDEEQDTPGLSSRQKNLIIFGIIALVLNLLAVIYVNLCREIYYWSNADYWNVARKIASGEYSGHLWSTVYDSILNSEFNDIPALISAVFIRLFGESRMVFILSLVNCYLLPADILIYLTAKKLGKAPLITTLIVIFTMPVMIYLTFNGFTEMGGFLMCMLCFYLYFRKDGKEPGVGHQITIGLLLAALMLWNNWFLFFSVSFVTAMLADAILFRKKWYMCLIALAVMIATVSFFFEGFMFRRLIAAYGNGSFHFRFALNMRMITRYLGLIFLLLMAAGSLWAMIKHRDRRPVFVWIQLIVCYLVFTATQTHGQGHLLMYVPGFIVLLILTIRYIHKEQALLGICLLAVIHATNVVIPHKQPSSAEEIRHCALFPNFSMRPVVRESAYDILTLKTTLDNIVPAGQYLGVLSYSNILNSELLKNAEPSLNIHQYRVDYIANTIPYFDLDNTDINPLCNANYMLVAYPAQTVREDQKVLETAVESFANWTDIATAYEEMYEYETVIDNVSIKLYHRVRDVSELEKAQFIRRMKDNINAVNQ